MVNSSRSHLLSENELILRESKKIVEALGKMFAPCCEVVLHDLTQPDHSIVAIECSLSGRKIGQSTTEMGLARIQDPLFPDIVQNYANTFADGRSAKSTSIGLRNSEGTFIAAICLNLDTSLFSSMQRILEQFTSCNQDTIPVQETLRTRSLDMLKQTIASHAAQYNTQAHTLSPAQREQLIQKLDESGLLHLKNAPSITADLLRISRATVYNILKKINK